MKKITIATCVGFTNRGSEALLRTRIDSIKKQYSNVGFNVLVIYRDSCESIEGVEYIQTFAGQREKFHSPMYLLQSAWLGVVWSVDAVLFRIFGRAFTRNIQKLGESDVFVSTDGDVLGEDYGLFPFLWRVYFLSLGLVLGKPIVIYSEGIGPFLSTVGKLVAKWFFNRCAYISVRDEISRDYLQTLGIRVPVVVSADSAFLLEPDRNSELNFKKADRLLVGISVSKLATKYGFRSSEPDPYQGFLKLMGGVIDWLIEKYRADIILIPHVVQVNRDDFEMANELREVVKNKEFVSIVDKTRNALELKGIISHCDLILASRMHASIAALSTGVPVVGIAYSHKMKGIFSLMGVESVVDIVDLDWDITEVITKTLSDAERIRRALIPEVEKMKQKAELPAEKVAELLGA